MRRTNPWGTWFVLASLFLAAGNARAADFGDVDDAAVETVPAAAPAAVAPSIAISAQPGFAQSAAQSAAQIDAVANNIRAALQQASRNQAPIAPAGLSSDAPTQDPGSVSTARPPEAFSEDVDISNLLVSEIDKVTATLDLRMHGCSLQNVVDAISRAADRGVKIRLIMEASYVFTDPDKGQHLTPQVQALMDLANAGKIQMKTLRGFGPFGVEHNKIGLFDGNLVTFGSFNFTNAADTLNHENLVFSVDDADIDWEQDRFDEAWGVARDLDKGDPGFLQRGFALSATASNTTVSYKGSPFPTGMSSPNGHIEATVVRAVDLSNSYVHMAMFSFYSMNIAKAMVAARNRGVKVMVVLEKTQAAHSAAAKYLFDNNMDIVFSVPRGPGGVLHDKFTVFDGELLETGSFNYTNNAEMHNFENAHFRVEPGQVGRYDAKFQSLYNQGAAAGLRPQASDFHVSQAPSNQGDTNVGDPDAKLRQFENSRPF